MHAPPPDLAPTPPSDSTSVSSPDPSLPDLSTTDPEVIAEESIAIRDEHFSEPNFQAFDQAQKQRAYDNDWMLRDYTAKLKKEGLANTPATDPSLVPQPDDPNAPQVYKDPLLPENQVAQPETRHRPQTDPTTELTPPTSLSPIALQPLLPPLNPSSPPLARRNAWGSPDPSTTDATAADMTAAFPALPAPRDLGALDESPDSLLDSPGLTAQREGLTKSNELDLQDPLPDENNVPSSRSSRNTDFLVPTAPTSDVSEFFRKQAEALQPPGPPTALRPAEAAAAPKPLIPLDAPEPLAKPPVSSLRTHVADPFDILNR
jgi:hypothetical protein